MREVTLDGPEFTEGSPESCANVIPSIAVVP